MAVPLSTCIILPEPHNIGQASSGPRAKLMPCDTAKETLLLHCPGKLPKMDYHHLPPTGQVGFVDQKAPIY